MGSLRRWLLSRQAQLTLQLSSSLVVTSLFTLLGPIHFSHACLVPVFVAVIVGSLAQDQHIGTRLQVCAWLLGPTWLAAILAGSLMSLAKLAAVGHPQHSVPAGYVAATAILGVLGLALLVFLQSVTPPGPGRVMGIIAVLIYGIMVTLSTLYPDVGNMWVGAVLLVVLGTVVAAVVAILVGFLVLPSLASDEVWRLTSEALQGAGTVLSYHTSLLMVDQPGAGSKDSKDSQAAAAVNRREPVPRQQHQQQQQQHTKGAHQQPQQHHHSRHDWTPRRQQPAHPTRRSSIDIADAGAAVVAASQTAFQPAAEAAAVALSWVDAADEAASTAEALPPRVFSSTRSEHSSADSITSLVGSDAIADAAAEYDKRFQAEQQKQQQQQKQEGAAASLGREPRLSEQLLQLADQQQQQQGLGWAGVGSGGGSANVVDAWVSAAAAVASFSRRGSLPTAARVSEDGSTATSLSGASLGALPGNSHHQQPRSLEGAASLDFMEELDDKTFIQMMRVLSQSKGGGAAPRPPHAAAAAAGAGADAGGVTPVASAALQAGVHRAAGGQAGMRHSKSAGSALSALSVAGSSTAPDDWARAVPASGQQLLACDSRDSAASHASPFAVLPHAGSIAGEHGPVLQPVVSTADSVVSSRASVLQPPSRQQRAQQPSRFAGLQSLLPVRQPQQQQQQQQQVHTAPAANGSISKRHSLGSRAWSFLTHGSLTSTAAVQSYVLHRKPSQQQSLPTSPSAASTAAGQQAVQPLLPAPTTAAQLQPLVGRAKAALSSARIEPWWLRPKSLQHFDADACLKLLDDVELLLVRLSTLEGVSEERSLMGLQLHQLAHYKGIADALALIFAQLTAFIVHVATAVGQQETCHCTPGLAQWLRRNPAAAGARAQPHSTQPQQPSGSAAAGKQGVPAAPPVSASARPSPFASGPPGEVGVGPDADGASAGFSALLSGMERQGSGVSSYLWEKKTGWGQAREMLKREMDASLGSYWWSVRKASKQLPVKVPRSREVMILIFLWPICNGVLEACERIEASAQKVLRPSPATQRANLTSSQQRAPASTATSRFSPSAAWRWLLAAAPWAARGHDADRSGRSTPTRPTKSVGDAAAATGAGQAARASLPQWSSAGGCLAGVRRRLSAVWQWVLRQGQWCGPLLQLVLVKPAWTAVFQAVTQDVPKTLSSRQSIHHMLVSRSFQSGLKLLMATSAVLLATVLLMAYIPEVSHSVPIFGYAAVVLCFQPRVEATVDQAARRVLGTILGACLGLATNSIPGIFEEPLLLLACLAGASVVLGVLARPQRRTAIVLALLTLCAVSLCGYEAACCSPRGGMRPVDTFVARLASVCGACIFVALFSRLVLPWYTSDYALEQLADALEQAALLFGQIYHSQLERMRLAELVAGQIKQQGPEVLQVHIRAAPAPTRTPAAPPAGADAAGPANGTPGRCGSPEPAPAQAPAVALAACEAAEARLLVVLRQQVLSRLVAVQLSLAKESVSWRRGVLATPPLVLNVLGAMNAVKEALTSQRLALAPFTRQGAASMGEQQQQSLGGAGPGSGGMLHMMVHCYSMWALPLHPVWMEIMQTVRELTAVTAAHLRRRPHGAAARAAARAQLAAKLEQLEAQRLELRHGWLDLRMRLHRAVHGGRPWVDTPAGGDGHDSFWPTDSVHLFTFTYGVSRCLNAFAAAAQAVANSLED